MSYRRRQSAPRKTPIAPDGTKLCKCGCGQPVGKGRRSWAGEECVEKWAIANNPQHVRMRLSQRDKGVCAKCGRNADRAQERCRNQWDIERRWNPTARRSQAYRRLGTWVWNECVNHLERHWIKQWPRHYSLLVVLANRRRERMAAEGWPTHIQSSWWQADHIVSVAEGGGQPTSLDAYQTLCHQCHVAKTAELRKRRSRLAKIPPPPP
jgi:5-methylcytosine-specific restriction endonuclease McrA